MKRALLVSLCCLLVAAPFARAGDHFDAPGTSRGGPTDLAGLYVFRSPTNANNTVLILTAGPFADFEAQPRFQPGARYEWSIDQTGDGFPELSFRASFGGVRGGVQAVKLTLERPGEKKGRLLAEGQTGQNLAVDGGGMFRAGLQDDPWFFDATGAAAFLEGTGPLPRPIGVAVNRFGPDANVLALVLELPSTSLAGPYGNTLIGVWGRVLRGKRQVDRVGRPLTNQLLVLPSDDEPKLRDEFNRGLPSDDVASFSDALQAALENLYGRTPADASAIAALLLPDVLVFEVGNPNGYGTFVAVAGPMYLGNGRRLRDDVADILLNLLSNGAIPTDNVADDNGTRITDGNLGTIAAFPYVGAPNDPGAGPNDG